MKIIIFILGFLVINFTLISLAGEEPVLIPDKGEAPDIIYIDVSVSQQNVADCYVPLAVDELSVAGGVKLYPNPNDGFFTLEVYDLTPGEEVAVSIFSPLGEKVFLTNEIAGGITLTSNMNLSFLSRGTYFVHVARGSGISVLKLIIL